MAQSACPGCGVELAGTDGPTHRYLESSPACWALYGTVLTREYSSEDYRQAHRLTVDAYAVQHPGMRSPRTIRSAAVHLVALYLVLETGYSLARATRALGWASQSSAFEWLEPPPSRGRLTVAHVAAATNAAQHAQRARQWAACAWAAWSDHHAQIERWAVRLEALV